MVTSHNQVFLHSVSKLSQIECGIGLEWDY